MACPLYHGTEIISAFFNIFFNLFSDITAYQQTKAVYVQYKKAKDKEKFLLGNESGIIIHEAAAKTLQAAKNGGKLKKKVKQYDTI